ncbi:MAG: hypothetical protein GXO29_06075 [Thermotogae bacterium]|nr:hypothetical protein [Thermotogota bacterium]
MMWMVLLSADTSVREVFDKGEIDWTHGVVLARGYGFMDPKRPKGQARLLAERAAVVDARRNLLEILKGVHITSETVVEDYMTTNDLIVQRVEGIVKGARVVGKPKYYDDGRVEVMVEVRLDTLAKELGPGKPRKSPPKDETPPDDVKQVIVKTPKGARACLYPRIVDEKGNVLLDFADYPEVRNAWSKAVKFVKGKVSRNEAGQMVIEAAEAHGCDIVVRSDQRSHVEKLKRWARYLFEAGKFIIDLVM